MEKTGYYLLLVEKTTYYVEITNTNPLELIYKDEKYIIRDMNLYKDDIFQGRIYNWLYAELEPHIDIVMRERESLLNTIVYGVDDHFQNREPLCGSQNLNSTINEYKVVRIVQHIHAYTLYDICKDGIYKQMLINDTGRFISSPNDWIAF